MDSLEIDLELMQRINKRFKVRMVAKVAVIVGLLIEIGFFVFLLLSQSYIMTLNFFPLPLLIFSIMLWLILYFIAFEMIDIREARESSYFNIKMNIMRKSKKRAMNFLILFIVLLVISGVIIIPFSQANPVQKNLRQGMEVYFPSSYNFGVRTVESIKMNGDGNIIILQNGSTIPVYQIALNGSTILNVALTPGYYEIIVTSGNVNVEFLNENSITPFILTLIGAITGIIIVVVLNNIISRTQP